MKKRIIILDDEPLMAMLMKEIINEDPQLEMVQMATEKKDFIESVSQNPYDVAIIDISVGGREGGIELLHIMKTISINLPLIILSAHDELHYALKCLQAGARGYINKKYICTDVIRCLNQVLGGYLFVSGDKGEHILKEYRKLNVLVG